MQKSVSSLLRASHVSPPLSIAQMDKNAKEPKRISALVNVEAWRKNENARTLDRLVKGTLVTVKGFFKPTEWVDRETGQTRQRVILAATDICIPDPDPDGDAPEEPAAPKRKRAQK